MTSIFELPEKRSKRLQLAAIILQQPLVWEVQLAAAV